MSLARSREIFNCWSWAKQTNIGTASLAAACKTFVRRNGDFLDIRLNKENDAADYGKSDEFATTEYITSWDSSGRIDIDLSSEMAAWAFAYGLGAVTESPSGTYTCTPIVPTTAMELPYFTYVETVRQGGSAVLDRAAIGCAVEEFTITVGTGPGRDNSRLSVSFVGSGSIAEPSTITVPAVTTPHLLPSASLACSIISMDYVTLKRVGSLEFGWKNNLSLDMGFYPGSGEQGGVSGAGAVRGRLLIGDRVPRLRYTAYVENGSTEWTKLKALTTGTAVITMTASSAETFTATFQKVVISVAPYADVNGYVAVNVETLPLKHSSNGVLSVVAKTALTGCAG